MRRGGVGPAVGGSLLLLVALGLVGVAGSVVLYKTVNSSEAFAYRGGFLVASLAASGVLLSVVCVPHSVLARVLSLTSSAVGSRQCLATRVS